MKRLQTTHPLLRRLISRITHEMLVGHVADVPEMREIAKLSTHPAAQMMCQTVKQRHPSVAKDIGRASEDQKAKHLPLASERIWFDDMTAVFSSVSHIFSNIRINPHRVRQYTHIVSCLGGGRRGRELLGCGLRGVLLL